MGFTFHHFFINIIIITINTVVIVIIVIRLVLCGPRLFLTNEDVNSFKCDNFWMIFL